MKVVYLNVYESKEPQVLDINDKLQEFYRLIKCDTIDIVRRKIGDSYYDVICDDEGLFVENPKISMIDNLGKPMLVGNIIICDADEDTGELEGLTDEQIAGVMKHIRLMCTANYPQGYYMATQCDY